MKYNFDEVIDRKGTHAMKVERLPKGADKDSLALWVADMDFACAEPILKALHERIDRKIFGYTMYDADECMDAVTGWMKKRYGWEESRENLFSVRALWLPMQRSSTSSRNRGTGSSSSAQSTIHLQIKPTAMAVFRWTTR
ncbi:MAG: hypothetical protein V8S93_14980 [Lachnospiraceae bacterium]